LSHSRVRGSMSRKILPKLKPSEGKPIVIPIVAKGTIWRFITTSTVRSRDSSAKMGIRRARSRTKATHPIVLNDPHIALIKMEANVICGKRIVDTVMIATMIGIDISQPCSSHALTNSPTPFGVFLSRKRVFQAIYHSIFSS